ncbi:MAG TPA: VOC family protein [Candidatus Solibacter sp.]|nr:VOC family protein [Candidatus Solibacter sp.]
MRSNDADQTQRVPQLQGQRREAMEFYKGVFGGELTINTFSELNASPDPSEGDKVMHSVLETDNGMSFMAADTPNSMEYKPSAGFGMSLSGDNLEELSGYFDKLSAGGMVTMPLEKAAWGDTFGMVVDKFGVSWLVNVLASPG